MMLLPGEAAQLLLHHHPVGTSYPTSVTHILLLLSARHMDHIHANTRHADVVRHINVLVQTSDIDTFLTSALWIYALYIAGV